MNDPTTVKTVAEAIMLRRVFSFGTGWLWRVGFTCGTPLWIRDGSGNTLCHHYYITTSK
jgi:hypothetical protein